MNHATTEQKKSHPDARAAYSINPERMSALATPAEAIMLDTEQFKNNSILPENTHRVIIENGANFVESASIIEQNAKNDALRDLQQVSIARLESIYDSAHFEHIAFQAVVDEIQSDKWEILINTIRNLKRLGKTNEHRVKKNALPAFSITGTYGASVTNAEFNGFSGLISVDFDHLPDPENAKVQLAKLPSVALAAVSPSGDGIKAFFHVGSKVIDADDFKKEFAKLCAYITATVPDLSKYLDIGCNDVRRLMFCTHDPKVYVNFNAKALDLNGITIAGTAKPIRTHVAPLKLPTRSIREGSRNNELTSFAGLLWSQGYDEETFKKLLLARNQYCEPPLDEGEVLSIARSIARYERQPLLEELSEEALNLRDQLTNRLIALVPGANAELVRQCVNAYAIQQIISGCFWEEPRVRFAMLKRLDRCETLIRCSEADFASFIAKAFNPLFCTEVLSLELQSSERENVSKAINGCVKILSNYIKFHRQASMAQQFVDMFIDRGYITSDHTGVSIVYSHVPFIEESFDEAVIEDYRQHFPEFDDVLDMIANARFASDRKKTYLWLKCPSDWGKGLFLGALGGLNASVSLSVAEAEKLFSGDPVGLAPELFTRANTLVFDEFKNVKSELKQFQNAIPVTAKNRLTTQVEVFAKLFLSAENVASLVGDHGLEDQFATRFSKIIGRGSIESRPLFMRDKGHYRRSLTNFMAKTLNEKYSHLISLGREKADCVATACVAEFHKKYGIDRHHDRLSVSLLQIAESIVSQLVLRLIDREIFISQEDAPRELRRAKELRSGSAYGLCNGHILIKNPAVVLDNWIDTNIEFSQRTALKRKRSDLMVLISTDCIETAKTYRDAICGKPTRGILLKPLSTQYQDAVAVLSHYLEK